MDMEKERNGLKRLLTSRTMITVLICALVSFVCITINSKNSFLYKLQDCDDAQCFMTIARCMRRGDILYKDIYEHKGIVLYFLYLIGNIISTSSFIGVYFIELLSFFVFVLFLIKTLRLFCKSDFANYCFAALIAIRATSVVEFRAGGQCEEFVLPLFAISLYLAFSQCLSLKKRDMTAYSIIIGLCFSAVFWMKYTLTGLYVGFALSVLLIGIINKDVKYILKNGLFFVLGALMGTIPVMLYFGVNKAIPDLWEVYFYTMLFKYGKSRSLGATKIAFQLSKVMIKGCVTVPFIMWVLIPKKQICKAIRVQGLLMPLFSVIGCACGVLQPYTFECFRFFAVFGYIGAICITKHLTSSEVFNSKLKKEKKSRFDRFVIKLNGDVANWKKEWETMLRPKFQSVFFSSMTAIGGLVLLIFLGWFPSPFRMYMSYDLHDYQLYRMKEQITERVPNDPQILYFNCTDMGLFFLTDTYPMDKYFCAYTLYKPEDLDYYNKYILTGKADFVAARKPQDQLEGYGYYLIYEDSLAPFVWDGGYWSNYLYARADLVNISNNY